MKHPTSPARLLRGLLICAAGVLPAVGAHVAAGGSASPSLLLLVTCLGLGAALAASSTREWSTTALVAALALTQGVVHAALWLTGSHSAHASTDQGLTTLASAPLHGATFMFLWHSIALGVSAVALRHGERLIHLFSRLLGSRPRALAAVTPLPAPNALLAASAEPVAMRTLTVLLGALDRRGPPVLIPAL